MSMRRRVAFIACLLLFAVASAGCGGSAASEATADARRTVVDATGRTVVLPARIERIGCLTGAAFEKTALVGVADKVVVRQATFPPWMAQTHPRVAEIPTLRESHSPNLEQLLLLKPDLLFFWDAPEQAARIEQSGIVVVSPQQERKTIASTHEFLAQFKAEIDLYGRVFGGAAAARAQAWSDYVDQRVDYVKRRLASLPMEQRPRTYYVRGPDALTTHGPEQNISWLGELAGADMVVRHSTAKGIARLSFEQVLVWDPEVIFVGRQYSPELVLQDSHWQTIAAVDEGRVYVIPDGVFFWDGSSEGILLLQYLAQKLHPERFQDLDIRGEVRDYYARFYHYNLSEHELDLLLAGRGPNEKRQNKLNN